MKTILFKTCIILQPYKWNVNIKKQPFGKKKKKKKKILCNCLDYKSYITLGHPNQSGHIKNSLK